MELLAIHGDNDYAKFTPINRSLGLFRRSRIERREAMLAAMQQGA